MQVDNAKNIDGGMSMYNLIEHNNNFSKTPESFFQYYKDKPALNDDDSIVDFADDNNNTHCVK